MISRRLIKSLSVLGLGIGVRSQGADSCVETITAKTGDTCASLAEFAGISVSQFLRSNPLVTRCDDLVGGAVYCKTGTASGTPTLSAGLQSFPSPAASSSPSDLRTSRDGTCGENSTCAGSRFGRCCSLHGFCGNAIDYCGEGCQIGFGQCGDVSPQSNAISIITVIATSTVRITDTVTATFLPSTTPTPPTTLTTLTTSTKPQSPTSKPTLTLPRTPNNCKTYDQIRSSDTCRTMATRNSLNLRDFYRLNPAIDTTPSLPGPFPHPGGPSFCSPGRPLADPLGLLCRINCEDLWEGYYVCTSAAGGWGFGPGW